MNGHSYTGKLLNHKGKVVKEIEFKDLPLVEVYWDDAWSDSDYYGLESVKTFMVAVRKNAGYLAHYDENELVITWGTCDEAYRDSPKLDGVLTIPWGMVKVVRLIDAPEIKL